MTNRDYITINALIVTTEASYISTQFSGEPSQAWHEAAVWAVEQSKNSFNRQYLTNLSPVFFKVAKDATRSMEQHTIGSLQEDLLAGRV